MAAPWSATIEPIWRWQREAWAYPVPKEATATTNLAALRGERVTEAVLGRKTTGNSLRAQDPMCQRMRCALSPLEHLWLPTPRWWQ